MIQSAAALFLLLAAARRGALMLTAVLIPNIYPHDVSLLTAVKSGAVQSNSMHGSSLII